MVALPWMLWAALTGCVTSADQGTPDDDAAVDDTAAATESDTEQPIDTGFGSDTDRHTAPPTDRGGPPEPPLDCHPMDPMSYEGWQRRYDTRTPNGQFNELHSSGGYGPVPAFAMVEGYINEVRMQPKGGGGGATTSKYFTHCGGAATMPALEVGYTVTSGQQTIRVATQTPHKYLPDEHDLYGVFDPSWQSSATYKMKVPVPGGPTLPEMCPKNVDGTRTVDASYVGMGWEEINVPALGGKVDAYRINIILDQTQSVGGGGIIEQMCQMMNFQQLFAQVFAEAFGFGTVDPATGGYVTASIDRWYVRGVGLVKEEQLNYQTREVISSKSLVQCSGLPGCP